MALRLARLLLKDEATRRGPYVQTHAAAAAWSGKFTRTGDMQEFLSNFTKWCGNIIHELASEQGDTYASRGIASMTWICFILAG